MSKHDHKPGETCPSCAEAGRAMSKRLSDEDGGISNEREITAFMHCGLCVMEVREKKEQGEAVAPREYARMEVGMTPRGLQVWCVRHEVNVLHVDFQGMKHPANTTRKADGRPTH